MPLPNFLVIGANKAGTTSLYRYLGQHPDVFVSPVKEPSYFTKMGTVADAAELEPVERRTQENVTRTLDDYLALFEGARSENARGEASTAYLSNPLAPARIRDAIPDVRLVAILRNPVERAFSAYSMHVQWGVEPRTFAEAVDAELSGAPSQGPRTHYVSTGLYGEQLTRYLDHFDRAQLRVYLYEDFGADPRGVLRDLYGFLGVDDRFEADLRARANITRPPSRIDRLPTPVRRVRALLPAAIRGKLRHRMSLTLELPDATRRALVEHYRDDVQVAARLIERDLASWVEPG